MMFYFMIRHLQKKVYIIYDVYGEHNCIHVSDEDASNFACNSISLKNHENSIATIIGNKFTNDLIVLVLS